MQMVNTSFTSNPSEVAKFTLATDGSLVSNGCILSMKKQQILELYSSKPFLLRWQVNRSSEYQQRISPSWAGEDIDYDPGKTIISLLDNPPNLLSLRLFSATDETSPSWPSNSYQGNPSTFFHYKHRRQITTSVSPPSWTLLDLVSRCQVSKNS